MTAVDWAGLRAAAAEAMRRAYAPYSNFPVGAAALVDDGRTVVGCNVENASYGLGLCAECGLVSSLHATGGGRLVAISCVDANGEPLMLCGRCRQLLYEHHVAVLHGSAYGPGGEGTLRVSFASGGDTLADGLDRLAQGLARL